MAGAARIGLLWAVCLTVAVPAHLLAATESITDLREVRRLIGAGRYLEAETAAQEQVDRLNGSADKSLARAEALDLWVEARWRNYKSWHPGTLEAAEWAVKLKLQQVAPDSPEIADSLFHQARVLDEWARFGEARTLYDRAIALYRRTVGTEDPKTAIAEAYLGAMLVELGELRAARPYLEGSERALEAALGPEHPALATALVPLAWLEKYARNVDEAEALFERALAIRESALGPNHPDVAEVLDGLTRLRWETTSLQAAREVGRRAEAIRLAAFGSHHASLAYNYVLLWWAETTPAAAQECLENAKTIVDATYPADHPMQGLILTYLALADDGFAGYAESWSLYERALQIYESAYGPNHWRVATVLGNMSGLWNSLGEAQRELAARERAQAIYATSEVCRFPARLMDGETDRREAAGELDLEEAIRRGEEAIELAHAVREPLFYLASIYEAQADRFWRAGRLAEAAQMFEKALATREVHAGAEHMHLMDPLRDYAELEAQLGDLDKALSLNRRALDILIHQLGPDNFLLQDSLDLEARLLWGKGELDGSLEVAQHLEAMLREVLKEAIVGLPEHQSLGVLAWQSWQRDLMISAAVAEPDPQWRVAAADALIRSRGQVLDSLTERHRGAHSLDDPRVARIVEEVGAARSQLARLAVVGDRHGDPDAYQQNLEAARRDKERAERALASYDLHFRRQREQSEAGLVELAAAVPPESALVAYTRYERFEPPSPGEKPSWPLSTTPSYAAVILRAGETAPRIVALGAADAIDDGVRTLSRLTWDVAETADRSPRRSLTSFRRQGSELRALIWDPVAPHLEGVSRVFVVPDGDLHLLPFAALPMGEAGYLIESTIALHYLSSERDLVGMAADPKVSAGEGLLAMGDPAYDETNLFAALAREDSKVFQLAQADLDRTDGVFRGQRANCGDFESMRFDALPASLAELQSIGRAWRQSAPGRPATLLDSAHANEAAFKTRAAGNRVLHLATHGYFLGGECDPRARAEHGKLLENPLVLSGLALAGANHRDAAGPDEEDGILTAEEIAALDLQGVQWAVLSGCETGVGETMAGEGVFGLRRAFQIAGARTVIMSLWPVDDEATRDWMGALYRHRFAEGATTLDAVHQASLDLLNGRRDAGLSTHPFYWAGFVAAGDWR